MLHFDLQLPSSIKFQNLCLFQSLQSPNNSNKLKTSTESQYFNLELFNHASSSSFSIQFQSLPLAISSFTLLNSNKEFLCSLGNPWKPRAVEWSNLIYLTTKLLANFHQRLQLRADLHQTICIVGVLLTSASTSALPMCVWIYLPIHIYVYISTSSIKHAICRFIQQQKRTHLSSRTYSSRSFPESTELNITTISAFITNFQQIKQVSCSDLNTSSMRMTITASTTVVCSMVPALLNDKISISQLQPMNSSYAILTKKKT